MPLPLKDRKIGAVEYVIKRLKGSDTYDRMKASNEQGPETMIMRDKPETDYQHGIKQSVNSILEAMQSKNATDLESSLRSFVKMVISSCEDDKELMEKDKD